jgi:hypothetical protein
MYDMLLVVSYLILLMTTVGFAFFLKYHTKKVAKLEEQVEFYRRYALKQLIPPETYPVEE